jgi:hypothetical protein
MTEHGALEQSQKATFCVMSMQDTMWVQQLPQIISQLCIPVFMSSDMLDLPFADIIDYSRISVKWSHASPGALFEYLQNISTEVVDAAQSVLFQV